MMSTRAYGAFSEKQFDERQLGLQGRVYWHGLLVAMVLVLVNAFLQAAGVVWADGFTQNIFILLITGAVVATEAILRDVFFGRRQNHWAMIIIYGVVGLLIVGVHASAAFQTTGIDRADHIVLTIAGVAFVCIAAAGMAKELTNRRMVDDDA